MRACQSACNAVHVAIFITHVIVLLEILRGCNQRSSSECRATFHQHETTHTTCQTRASNQYMVQSMTEVRQSHICWLVTFLAARCYNAGCLGLLYQHNRSYSHPTVLYHTPESCVLICQSVDGGIDIHRFGKSNWRVCARQRTSRLSRWFDC